MTRRPRRLRGAWHRRAATGIARWLAVVVAVLLPAWPAGAAGPSPALPSNPVAGDVGRGQLLYETHCRACHTTQMHWRENRRVQDWAGLLAQVQQWQARAQLRWTDEDVQAVARHLNDRIYRLPAPEQRAAVGPAR